MRGGRAVRWRWRLGRWVAAAAGTALALAPGPALAAAAETERSAPATASMDGAAEADFLRDLMRLHLEALGGFAALEALENTVATGVNRLGDREFPVRLTVAWPGRLRLETRTGPDELVIQAVDGDLAWRVRRRAGRTQVEPMDADEARLLRSDADLDGPFIDYDRKGHTAGYLGEGTVRGRPVVRVEVTERGGLSTELAFDAETFLLAKKTAHRRLGGRQLVLESYYSDWRPVAGVAMAHRVETVINGGESVAETRLDHIEPNVALPAGLFALPEAEW
jgi:hypothetical protein